LQLVKKIPAFYGTRRFIKAFTISATRPYPEPPQSSPHPHTPLPGNPSEIKLLVNRKHTMSPLQRSADSCLGKLQLLTARITLNT